MAVLLFDEVRLTRDAMRYGYAVGKVRVLETKRLDAGALERLLDAPSFAEQKRLITETPYARFLEGAQTAEQVEAGLSEALESFYAFLDDAALPEEVTRFFRLRYDFANLKGAVKARLLGMSTEGLLGEHGTLPASAFMDLEAVPEPFGAVAADVLSAGREGGSPNAMVIETMVDKAMFASLLETAKSASGGFLVELAKLAIDLANVKTIVRGLRSGLDAQAIEALLIDGGGVPVATLAPLARGSVADLSAALSRIPSMRALSATDLADFANLDVALDTVTSAALRRGGRGTVGPEPVISYVFAREAEVAVLRMLLLGKLAGLSEDVMRRRVGTIG